MKITIGPDKLQGEVKKLPGFLGLNCNCLDSTGPWDRLSRVGRGAIPKDKRPFTGNIDFFINDGGIGHETLSKHFKKVFREDVLPAIRQAFPSLKNTYHITLHYNVDVLDKLTFNDE